MAPPDPERLDDPDAVSALLRGTALDGAAVSEVTIDSTNETAIVIEFAEPTTREVPWEQVFSAWSAARALLPQTGRWPVGVPLGDAPPFHRGGFREWDHTPAEDHLLLPQALLRDAAATHPSIDDLAEAIGRPTHNPLMTAEHRARSLEFWEGTVKSTLRATTARIGSAPAVADVLKDVEPDDNFQLDRWLFDWEEARRPTTSRTDECAQLQLDTAANAVVLLPVQSPWQTAAYMHYFGGGEGRAQQLPFMARLAGWERNFGLEVIANGGLTLTCRMTRPPESTDAAYDLALELFRYSLGGSSPREIARFVLGNPEPWTLYSRP